jgi:DNA-binding transcriptional MerR regulator
MSSFTIAAAAARSGLPESTLRYWERIGLVSAVARDNSSGHRRYSVQEVDTLETLANLRAVGLSIEDMRAYLHTRDVDEDSAAQRRTLFQEHADRLREEIVELQVRLRYLDLKVAYWSAIEADEPERADGIATELGRIIHQINPKDSTS